MDELEQYATQALEENKLSGIIPEGGDENAEAERLAAEANEDADKAAKEAADLLAKEEANKEATKAAENSNQEPKSILDVLSSLNTETEKPKEAELPEDIKAKLVLAEKYEQFVQSDLGKLLDTDLTVIDLLQSVKVIDYSKMTAEQLIEAEAKMIAGDRFTDELLEAEMDAYNALTPKQKIEHEKNLIEKLGKSKTEINNDFAKLIESHQSAKKANQVPATNFDEVAKAEKSALENTLNDLATKYGVEKEIIDGIKGLYSFEMAGHFVDKKTNKFNEREFIQFTYKAVAFDKEIAKVKAEAVKLVAEAEAKAYEKAKKEFTNPDAHGSGGQGGAELSPEEAYKIAMNGR